MNVACPICHRTFSIDEKDFIRCPNCDHAIDPIQLLTVSVDPDATVAADPTQLAPKLAPGDNLAQFRLLKVLGSGGFGTVYEAFDSRLERHVALKVPLRAAMDQDQAKAFIKEARAAAKLRHPNIVSVFEVGRDGKHIFIVSELIKGTTLRERIKLKSLDEQQATRLMKTIAEAMHNAHQTGIAHRDLKPGNILLDEQGEPHVADFGLAKLISAEDATQTEIGAVLGTPAYMSPEQASGNSTYADSRTDIYAMGVIYYEMLTGKKPYVSSSTTILEEIQSGEAPGVREIAPHVSHDAAAVCEKAMAVAPIDRYQSTHEFAEELDAIINGNSVKARQVNIIGKAVYWSRKRIASIFVVATLLFMFAALMTVIFNSGKGPPRNAKTPPLPSDIRRVRISASAGVSQLLAYGIDDETYELSKQPTQIQDISDSDFEFEAKPGFYLFKAIGDQRTDEFFRVIPGRKTSGVTVIVDSQITNYSVTDGIVRLEPFERVESDDPNFSIHKMVSVPGGKYRGGSSQKRTLGRAHEYRFDPQRDHPIESFEVSETEVTALQFRKVMNRYPRAMLVDRDEVVADDLPAAKVTWLEAVEYCERTGTRLPKFLEYRYLATNFGKTEFPSTAASTLETWPAPQVKVPADEVNSIGVYNLYSSLGEWAWDINLKPNLNLDRIPDESGNWRFNRIIYGMPRSSFATPVIRRREGDGTDYILDKPYYKYDRAVGFRVVRPKK